MAIHPTAVVEPGAEIDPSCEIGPYAVIGAHVRLGPSTEVGAHAVIAGRTTLGAGNRVFPHAALGGVPQDLKYRGEPTTLAVGDRNTFREFTTVNIGTAGGGGVTRIGSGGLFMAYCHVGHDCQIGDHVMLVNGATLGGHVTVEDWATVGALCPVHHFVRIGAYAFVGGGTTITRDVLPFSKTAAARDTHAYGLNALGLERRGFSKERIRKIHHAYRLLLASKLNTTQALEKLKAEPDRGEDVDALIRFIESSDRGVIK